MPSYSPETTRVIAAFRAAPRTAGIFTDFDGTLSEVVDEPRDATAVAGAPELLNELAAVYRTVAIVSGRPVAFLREKFPPNILLSGLYGLETQCNGEYRVAEETAAWIDVIDSTARRAAKELPASILIENKKLALTLHYRAQPTRRADVEAWADAVAAETGLVRAGAKMSVELNLPLQRDKGSVLAEHAGELTVACFIGDDRGDLSAFAQLAAMRARGVTTLAVAVDGDQSPRELLDAADQVVDGPSGAMAFLATLRS